jgi:DNA-binding NarL/FixJ family response regulator
MQRASETGRAGAGVGAGTKVRVLVVDDHRASAQALTTVMSMQPDLLARSVASHTEAVRTAADEAPDVVLIAASLQGEDGIELAARLMGDHPSTRVLLLNDRDDDVRHARALAAGVYGFVSRLDPLEQVLDVVRKTAAGQTVVDLSDGVGHGTAGRRRRLPHATERQRSERLSPREREILQLMVDGLESPEVADRLGISMATLRTHVYNILKKLGVHSKTQAVLLAVRQGRVSTGS